MKLKSFLVLALIFIMVWGMCACNDNNDKQSREYVGSVYSDIYHYPSCEWAHQINLSNEIWFDSISDAHRNGYRACKICRPDNY